VLQRDVQGLLVEPRNHRALAAALYALARDPELRHQMGEAGRQRAPEYSWPRVSSTTTRSATGFLQLARGDGRDPISHSRGWARARVYPG
jgi:glycosyltransferase involved in cell wall biosynthesis